MRTLSKSDIDLLKHIHVFQRVAIDPKIPHAYLHPLLDLGLGFYRLNKFEDFGLCRIAFDEQRICFGLESSTISNQGVAKLLNEFDNELAKKRLPASTVEILSF